MIQIPSELNAFLEKCKGKPFHMSLSVGVEPSDPGVLTFVHFSYRRTSLCIPGRETEHNPNKWAYSMIACSICKSQE